MKSFLQITALVAALALIAGCSSTGYEKGNQTAINIQKAADQITLLSGQVDKTLASLNDLVNKPQSDLRPQFKTFSENVGETESSARQITATRMEMGTKGREFFAKWDEELAKIQNEDIKARSEARKTEVSTRMQGIKKSYGEAELAFRPFMSDLKDIQKYLSVDLTTAGLATIKGTVTKANKDAVPLKESAASLVTDFRALGFSMSSVALPTAK